jgi:hypothetical protein
LLRIECSVNAVTTTLSGAATPEAAVRARLGAALEDPAALDSAFSAVTVAACAAQGVPANLCPNPPSLVLSLASPPTATPQPSDGGGGGGIGGVSLVVVALAGGVAAGAVLATLFAVLWCRAKSSHAKVVPEASTTASGVTVHHVVASAPAPGGSVPAPVARNAWS